jgi:hypothetical protein
LHVLVSPVLRPASSLATEHAWCSPKLIVLNAAFRAQRHDDERLKLHA